MTKPLVIITGASSGFGAKTAELFSQKGHPLLLLARREEKMKDLNLPKCMIKRVDVRERELFSQAVEEAENEFGPADCLVNNAGVMLLGQMAEQSPDEWQKMVDVNVIGVLNGIHGVLPGMVKRGQGTIINISSIAGRKTFANHAAYCATKFAVHALSENLREEVSAHNVRVTVIAPGAAETELLGHTTSKKIVENYSRWKSEIGGVLQAEDVARTIIFAYEQPQNLCIREIVLAATKQPA